MKTIESKRLTATYVVIVIWTIIGVIGIIMKVNMAELAVYISTVLPIILGYLYSETKRPSKNNDCNDGTK